MKSKDLLKLIGVGLLIMSLGLEIPAEQSPSQESIEQTTVSMSTLIEH